MTELPFDQVIANSPVLSDPVREVLLANAETMSGENKQAIIDTVLDFEQKILIGAESFLASLGQG